MNNIRQLSATQIDLFRCTLPQEYNNAVEKIVHESSKFKNPRYIKYLLEPLYYSKNDWSRCIHFTDTIYSIAQKIVNAYYSDIRIQRFYDFDKLLHQLLLAARTNECRLPCMRIDLLFQSGKALLCEINCDGSAGMRKDMVVNESLLSLAPYRAITQSNNLSYKNLISAQTDMYIKSFIKPNQVNHESGCRPVVAITNFRDSNDFEESMLYVTEYRKHGVQAILADPRDLVFYCNALYHNGRRIDYVQKEVDEPDLIQHKDSCADFIGAILNKATYFIGSAIGKIIDDKAFFALLHSSLVDPYISSYERDFIRCFVPLTYLFRGDKELLERVSANKEKYILKSRDTYGGVGVIAGKSVSKAEWQLIAESTWNTNYIVQEFIETDTAMYPYINNDTLEYGQFRITVGLFCYNGVLSGFYSRASKDALVNDYGPNDYYLGNLYYS